MALNKEDKADVKNAMGRALANKVSDATKDFGKGKIIYKSKGFDKANKEYMQKRKMQMGGDDVMAKWHAYKNSPDYAKDKKSAY